MEELRLAFLVIGGVAIIGILAHGMWSVRKNSQEKGHANLETQDWDDEYDDDIEDVDVDSDVIVMDSAEKSRNKVEPSLGGDNFDELGIGAVRVVSQAPKKQTADDSQNTEDGADGKTGAKDVSETDLSEDASDVIKEDTNAQANDSEQAKPKIYSSVVTQPKPEYAAQQVHAMRSRMSAIDNAETGDIPEPPPFLLRTNELESGEQPNEPETTTNSTMDFSAVDEVTATAEVTEKPKAQTPPTAKADVETAPEPKVEAQSNGQSSAENKVSLADQARNFVKRSKAEPKSRKRKEPKIREDQMKIDFDEPESKLDAQGTQEKAPTNTESDSQPPEQQVLVLNVRANDDNPIQGAALLPMLLTLGFKFGDQDIFHRHVNSNGKGPVLFSLANMFKPGVFDIDNLENFTTLGVSLFMMLPIEGDPHQVFNMMHNAARKIADEFSAQVLDGRRSALTKQSLQQYVEKIREFERKRMIAR
ncbi:cell division protein ZipA [Aliiglaciecola sp. SL4]|uniref:cell division protein ZipA n=1 Tax=Aliiglaciecola sp. SL4 TaxID=3239806 RepID=UPI00355B5229